MKKFIKSMLSSASGDVSSKRVIAFIGFLALAGTMVANSFTHEEIKPSPELVSAVEYVTIACLFGTSLDNFAGSKNNGNKTSEEG
jgi:hypothetical protein